MMLVAALSLSMLRHQGTIVLPLQFIALANSDGSDSHAKSTAECQALVNRLNRAYQSAGIQFSWSSQDYKLIRNTVINTNFDLNRDFIKERTFGEHPRQQGWAEHDSARNRITALFPDKVCCFLMRGSAWVWDPKQRRYLYTDKGPSWGAKLADVALLKDGGAIVHEIGHFLGLAHSYPDGDFSDFGRFNKTVNDYVLAGHPIEKGLDVFDYDMDKGVMDTPPDPGPPFWSKFRQPTVTATVHFDDGRSFSYTLMRNPTNFMGGSADKSVEAPSPSQARVCRETALEKLRRIRAISGDDLANLIRNRTQSTHEMGPNIVESARWKLSDPESGSLIVSPDGLVIVNPKTETIAVECDLPDLDHQEYELSYEARADNQTTVVAHVLFKDAPDYRLSAISTEWMRITRTFKIGNTSFPTLRISVGHGTSYLRHIALRKVDADVKMP